MSYVTTESMRLSLYSLIFLDAHISSIANSRPLLSAMELNWELPYPASLWEAKNSAIWLQRAQEELGTPFGIVQSEAFQCVRGIGTTSLSIATQQLMIDTSNAELLSALKVSPFATFCVLTNIGILVRDFTRCYYQMPPSPSDPSAFHILTQSQNKQVHTAIRAIANIVKEKAYAKDDPHYHLWRTIEIYIFTIRISLSRPDQLLVGGIIDNSLIAGMATSTLLTRGNFVAIRRSAPIFPPNIDSNEGILALLGELSRGILTIFGDSLDIVTYEPPWATVASYGILLCIWGALSAASTEICCHIDTFNELPRTSDSCFLIFNTLMESSLQQISPGNERWTRDHRLWSRDQGTFTSLLQESETFILAMIGSFCRQRYRWGIGPSMIAVLGEIPNMTPESTEI